MSLKLLFTIWILFQSSDAVIDLPGIDVLTSGYDGAAWTSKFRIFDFGQDGVTVVVDSINKTYTAPAMVTVVTNGMNSKRVEESCVSVATTFRDYLYTYQRSTKFDVGFSSDDFKLGLSYHLDVKEVYESIESKGQAIGVSESWWGMYEVIAPPVFLLTNKLDPIFAQSKAYLLSIGVPQSESDQFIYNQVCCGSSGFGTHYVGSLISGARATITTFVNSSFHHEYSQTIVSEQISIGFDYEKFHLSLNDQADEMESQLMEDYKNSSNRRVSYEPDVPEIHASDAPWLAWEIAAADNPTAVNTSVSSLANLFFETPDVMAHMQRTIDFYLKNSRAPTLAELQAPPALRLATDPLVPGLQVVGCGFDAPSLSSRACIFDIPDDSFMTWTNPYYPEIKYSVPMGFYAMNTPESLLLNSTIIMNTIEDYIENSVWSESHHSSGFLGFGSKTETTTTEKYYRMFYAHTYSLALSLRQIAWYTLSLMEFPLPKFNSMFQAALDYLPKEYDPNNAQTVLIYKMFFDSYGTSIVTEADMGGLVWAETWFESCLQKTFSDVCISHEVHKGWWLWHESDEEHSCDTHLTEDFASYSEWHFEMLGGTSQVNISEWEDWALTVKYDPRPVKMRLVPIHYLLADSHPSKQALVDATNDYLARNEQDKKDAIDAMTNVRPPPPEMCTKYDPAPTVTTDSSTAETPASKNIREVGNDDDPRDQLCPIVGYHGAFCPAGPDGKSFDYSFEALAARTKQQQELPKGIGLTIDVSTGDLKLPAWEFTFDGAAGVWTDPITQETYALPSGLALNVEVAGENVVSTRIFKSASDLVSVWESGYTAGNWLGGEFGNSKSVLNLYNQFFSQQQSTSINQHPQALYRLTLTDNWETHLNAYAMYALQSLPEVYDENIYSRFMDTWGTHVARDTLVGGMFEQQIVMKDCIFANPYLTGGLTDEQLQQYLAMDLAQAPPQDSFYSARRQMNIDHRIGGNPELSDQATWVATLAKNPALIKIYSHVIWSEVATRSGAVSATVAANLQTAITARMAAREAERQREREEVERQRIAELQGPRSVIAVVAHGRRGDIVPSMETGQYLTMNGFAQCPAGLPVDQSKANCNTGLYIESWNTHHVIEPLRYERNEQGEMSSIRCWDLDGAGNCLHHSGPFVRNGCSLMPKADGTERNFHEPVPDSTVVAMVCADCEIMSASFPQDAILRCICPGYPGAKEMMSESELKTEVKIEKEVEVMENGQTKVTEDEGCYDTFQPNGMPNFKQCDPKWKCYPYAGHDNASTCTESVCTDESMNNNICISGCGIVTSSMVINYWGFRDLDPVELADWMLEEGFRDDLSNTSGATCNGVSHEAMCSAAKFYGMKCQESKDFADLDEWLKDGPVIAHLRHKALHKCKFTTTGHYVTIVEKNIDNNDMYTVSDPNSCLEERTHGTVDEISKDCQLVGFIRMIPEA